MINKVILVGNLGGDPETKETKTSKLCRFSLATSEKFKKDGEYQEQTEWHNVVVWGKSADFCEKYLNKGDKVYVEGKIQTRTYEKDGEKKYFTEINAYNVKFLSVSENKPEKAKQSNDDDLPF